MKFLLCWYSVIHLNGIRDIWALEEELKVLQGLKETGHNKIVQQKAHCIYRNKHTFHLIRISVLSIKLISQLALLLPVADVIELIQSKEFERLFLQYSHTRLCLGAIMQAHQENPDVKRACHTFFTKIPNEVKQRHMYPSPHISTIPCTYNYYKGAGATNHYPTTRYHQSSQAAINFSFCLTPTSRIRGFNQFLGEGNQGKFSPMSVQQDLDPLYRAYLTWKPQNE